MQLLALAALALALACPGVLAGAASSSRPPGKPGDERGAHLFDVHIPTLSLQGTRDEFADLSLPKPLVNKLGACVTLKLFDDADHSFPSTPVHACSSIDCAPSIPRRDVGA
jgi:predicted alpha/beta-hydrolase family hydrolase